MSAEIPQSVTNEPAPALYPVELKAPEALSPTDREQVNNLILTRLADEYGGVTDAIADITDPELHADVMFMLARDDEGKIIGSAAIGNATKVKFLEGDSSYAVMSLSSIAVAEAYEGKGIGSSLVHTGIVDGPKALLNHIKTLEGTEQRVKGISDGAVVYMETDKSTLSQAAIAAAETYGDKVQFTSDKAKATCIPRQVLQFDPVDGDDKMVEKFVRKSGPATDEKLKQYEITREVANRLQEDTYTQYKFISSEDAKRFLEEAEELEPDEMPKTQPAEVTTLPTKEQVRIAFELDLK